MNLFRLSTPDNPHLCDSNISRELEYILINKSLINAHLKQSQYGILFPENTTS